MYMNKKHNIDRILKLPICYVCNKFKLCPKNLIHDILITMIFQIEIN